jgi:hypothetical protein
VRGIGIGRRLLWILGVTILLLLAGGRSLVATSNPLSPDQRLVVLQAMTQLEQAGFSREVFALRYLASIRSTDNWWNLYLGHREAYAATNFPFEVVTLYPPFFQITVDDTERAVILLHEADHLLGDGEDAALARVWHDKQRLGWTAERYGQTKVWKNTIEWTASSAPALFRCGSGGHADCVP